MKFGFATRFVAVVLLAGAPPLARAQMFNQMGGGQLGGGGRSLPSAPAENKVAPPPALPGAAAPSSAAPSSRPPTDMEPNDALFDAINRGDIATARDAINRGADLGARNVLGMTPIELSVDLGRNGITFMLLSMRGGDDGQVRPAPTADRGAKSPPKQQAKQVPVRPTPRDAAAAPAQSQTARLYGGDGGAPNPNAGFLGFDASRR